MILLTVMITAWDHNDFVLLTVDPRQVSSKLKVETINQKLDYIL